MRFVWLFSELCCLLEFKIVFGLRGAADFLELLRLASSKIFLDEMVACLIGAGDSRTSIWAKSFYGLYQTCDAT